MTVQAALKSSEVGCLVSNITPARTTSSYETHVRDVTPPSVGEEEEKTTWDLRLRGRKGLHREETNCSLLLLALLWREAPKYSMNIKQSCHVGSPALGDLGFRTLTLSRSWDVRCGIILAQSWHIPSHVQIIYWRHPEVIINILKSFCELATPTSALHCRHSKLCTLCRV